MVTFIRVIDNGVMVSNTRKRLVTVTTELSPELAEKFHDVVNKKFGGDIDEAVSQAIKLLISRKRELGSDLR